MIKDIIIIDDIIPESYQDEIEEQMMGMGIPWTHVRDIALNDEDLKKLTDKQVDLKLRPGFSFRFYQYSDGILSPLWLLIKPIAIEACKRINFNITQFVSVRSFLTTSLADSVKYDNPHADLDVSHLVCLYYVNDSDGDTFLFDKRNDQVTPDKLDRNNLAVVKQVSPKKGRVLLFDGRIYHSSSRPTSGSRCIINFDIF